MTDVNIIDELFRRASEQQARAYAPYSKFYVGAAILSVPGHVYAGANVENAASPLGACAELSAIAAMVAAGDQAIDQVLIVGARRQADGSFVAGPDELCTPCGGCRQRLREFASARTLVHVCGPEGLRRTFELGELLPFSFSLDPRG